MKPDKLYLKLQKIRGLEKRISEKEGIELGDQDVMEYNRLFDSIKILSSQDLMTYHNFMIEELEKEEGALEKEKEALITELRTKTLRVLRDACSPHAYSEIESVLEDVFRVYRG